MRKPRTPKELGFNGNDTRKLARALKRTKDLRCYRRLQAVLLVARGRAVPDVAEITACKPWAIYSWVRRYLERHQVECLADAPRSGRPRAAPEITNTLIARELRRDPLELGYNSTQWTVELLATHLRKLSDSALTARTLRRRMREMGLRWKRPRHSYSTKAGNRAQKKGESSGV